MSREQREQRELQRQHEAEFSLGVIRTLMKNLGVIRDGLVNEQALAELAEHPNHATEKESIQQFLKLIAMIDNLGVGDFLKDNLEKIIDTKDDGPRNKFFVPILVDDELLEWMKAQGLATLDESIQRTQKILGVEKERRVMDDELIGLLNYLDKPSNPSVLSSAEKKDMKLLLGLFSQDDNRLDIDNTKDYYLLARKIIDGANVANKSTTTSHQTLLEATATRKMGGTPPTPDPVQSKDEIGGREASERLGDVSSTMLDSVRKKHLQKDIGQYKKTERENLMAETAALITEIDSMLPQSEKNVTKEGEFQTLLVKYVLLKNQFLAFKNGTKEQEFRAAAEKKEIAVTKPGEYYSTVGVEIVVANRIVNTLQKMHTELAGLKVALGHNSAEINQSKTEASPDHKQSGLLKFIKRVANKALRSSGGGAQNTAEQTKPHINLQAERLLRGRGSKEVPLDAEISKAEPKRPDGKV